MGGGTARTQLTGWMLERGTRSQEWKFSRTISPRMGSVPVRGPLTQSFSERHSLGGLCMWRLLKQEFCSHSCDQHLLSGSRGLSPHTHRPLQWPSSMSVPCKAVTGLWWPGGRCFQGRPSVSFCQDSEAACSAVGAADRLPGEQGDSDGRWPALPRLTQRIPGCAVGRALARGAPLRQQWARDLGSKPPKFQRHAWNPQMHPSLLQTLTLQVLQRPQWPFASCHPKAFTVQCCTLASAT